MDEQEWRKEEERLAYVSQEIKRRTEDLQEQGFDQKSDIVEFRTNFWDDVTINFSDASESAETFRSMKQQADVLLEKERAFSQGQSQLRTLDKMGDSPYFGRVDFVEKGGDWQDSIYLGIASLLDEDDLNFLVYDWRAPISSLYYDYPPGAASYAVPDGGKVEGDIELKRQYVIRNGKMLNLFDAGVTIGDELLQEVLGKQADTQMRSIVATIQQEQNKIIRDVKSKLLIVQGPAGSGKTSAALQRVAYLLYRFRDALTADQIVLFSPHTLFNSYVSSILPELGEENMMQTTFQLYVQHRLGARYDIEDPLEQMEYVLTAREEASYSARIAAIRYKSSAAFMHVVERYAEGLRLKGLRFKDVTFRGEAFATATEIEAYFYSLGSYMKLPNRVQAVVEWLLTGLSKLAREEKGKQWVEDEAELLSKADYAAVQRMLRKKKGRSKGDDFDDFSKEQEALAQQIVKRKMAPVRKFVKDLAFIDLQSVYGRLYADDQLAAELDSSIAQVEQWSEICALTLQKLEKRELFYEDAAPYLYLQELIEGFQTNNLIRHVFIDEAQDYSPFQFAFIGKLFPRSKMTVLGDINQAIYLHAGESEGMQQLQQLFPVEESLRVTLQRTYRSTKPIVTFTSGMLTSGDDIIPFNRDGELPTVSLVPNEAVLHQRIAEIIAALQAKGHQTIAVICKTGEESRSAYEQLQPLVEGLSRISIGTLQYVAGPLVIPSYLAKGVEFDAVIIYDAAAEQYGREDERKLFYTACTRAMHELHIFSTGELSPFIRQLDDSTYTLMNELSVR